MTFQWTLCIKGLTLFPSVNKITIFFNSLRVNPTKWSNTLKQLVDNLPTNSLSVFDHLVGLVIKGLNNEYKAENENNRVYQKSTPFMEKLSPSWKIHNKMHNKTSFTEFNYCYIQQ